MLNVPRLGLEPRTARFEVQILGEELLRLLRCAFRESIAFFISFCFPIRYEPRTPGLTAPRLVKIGVFHHGKFAILYSEDALDLEYTEKKLALSKPSNTTKIQKKWRPCR
jgi:hypothetical protein